ncbi:MAG: hypothetical protein ACWGQW_23645 [bacterium]
MDGKCERCYKETMVTTCSRFNTQMICMECEDKEQKHPDYQRAKDAEMDAVRRGDYNYAGIGLPTDL